MPLETLQQPGVVQTPPRSAVTTLQRGSGDSKGSWAPFLLAIGGIGLLATLFVGYRWLYTSQQLKAVRANIATMRSQYDSMKELELKTQNLKGLSDALTSVYETQVSYTALIKKLEESTFSGARYDSLSLDQEGQVLLTGKTDTYLSFAKVVKAFKEKLGSTPAITQVVEINSVGQDYEEEPGGAKVRKTSFSIAFNILPELLQVAHPGAKAPVAVPMTSTPTNSSTEVETPAPTSADDTQVIDSITTPLESPAVQEGQL